MPTISETIQKVQNFTKLPKGWHYGEGEPVDLEMAEEIERFLLTAEGWEIEEANAFPGIDGQVELTFYVGDKTFAFMFELDGTVSITEEKRGEIISDIYDQPYEVAEQRLWELSQKIQTIYVLSTLDIGMRGMGGLGVQRFNARPRNKTHFAAYQSFRQNAYWRQKRRSANTSRTSTVQLRATRSSFCA